MFFSTEQPAAPTEQRRVWHARTEPSRPVRARTLLLSGHRVSPPELETIPTVHIAQTPLRWFQRSRSQDRSARGAFHVAQKLIVDVEPYSSGVSNSQVHSPMPASSACSKTCSNQSSVNLAQWPKQSRITSPLQDTAANYTKQSFQCAVLSSYGRHFDRRTKVKGPAASLILRGRSVTVAPSRSGVRR
jgi:hypothetical protein